MPDAAALALQAVGGFVLGGIIGYAIRKAAKWVLIAIGFFLLPVFGLWYLGLLSVNWDKLNEVVGRIVEWLGVNLSNMTSAIASAGVFGISGIVGFLFGLSGLKHSALGVGADYRFVRRRSDERGDW